MTGGDLQALWLTTQVAFVTTVILLLLSIPLAWGLSRMQSRWRVVLDATIALPLVLPPTVLGFYLLIAMSPDGAIGVVLRSLGFDGRLSFSFAGLVFASVLYSLPFAVHPLTHAFSSIPRSVLDAAATLGASPWDRFLTVVLPLSRGGLLTAATLTFAHTVGEFGVVLMVGGNIPGSTQMVSIAIFDHVEALDYAQAHVLAAVMMLFSLTVLSGVYALNRRWSVML